MPTAHIYLVQTCLAPFYPDTEKKPLRPSVEKGDLGFLALPVCCVCCVQDLQVSVPSLGLVSHVVC